jgi:SpoVK/Ycf46/Vps4 family AAA+-type ATPase
MASAQQLIGLVKSHAEGDEERFFDLAMQLAAAESQKGHTKLAEQLRQWAEASRTPQKPATARPTPLATPRGDLAGFLDASYPSTRLKDVILPFHLEDELAHIVTETRMRERLEEKGLRPRRRLLLAGPPGTGKTLSAAALAGELRFPLFTVLLHGLITKFMGETAQKLRMIFDAVRNTRGVYLFDEIDALAAARGAENDIGEARRILNSFLQFLDEDTGPSIVVATTNLPQILDRAILRRFDLVLPYEMPTGSAIEKALRRRLTGFEANSVDWGDVTNRAEGLSTADVVAAAEDAARRTVLANQDRIETTALIASLDRRRALHGIGGMAGDDEGSRALYSAGSRKSAGLQSQRGRVVKKAK